MLWIHWVVPVTYLSLFCKKISLQGESDIIIKTKQQNEKYGIILFKKMKMV